MKELDNGLVGIKKNDSSAGDEMEIDLKWSYRQIFEIDIQFPHKYLEIWRRKLGSHAMLNESRMNFN